MDRITPLAGFPVIATNNPEEAEFCLSRFLADVQINQVDDKRNFRLELNAFKFKSVSLIYNSFRSQTILSTGQELDHAIFVTGIGVPITLCIDNELHLVTQTEAAIVAPARKVRIERPAHSEILYLRVPLSDLWSHFERLTDRHHRGSLVFDRNASVVKGPGAMLKGLMDYLVNRFAFDDSVMKTTAIRESFDDLLITSMLSLPHSKMDQLYEDRSRLIAPAVVRRAEEYIRTHLKKPITISDLVQVCECSRSSLFSAFRSARNYTPIEFLTEQRLHQAREQLLKSKSKATVSSVALNCGFINHGWFSQVYKKRFGERPSDTLRRRK